jgi:hypothetical protein
MKTKNTILFSAILASAAALGFSAPVFAQSDSQASSKPAKQRKPAAKPHRVWTNDEIGSVRTPADAYIETEQQQTDRAGAGVQTASEKQPIANAPKTSRSPALSNPKTTADADRMIDWVERDVEGQEEFLVKLKQEIAEAPDGERKDRLLKVLQERQQILADTRRERQALQGEKASLKKQASAPSTTAAPQPPSQ